MQKQYTERKGKENSLNISIHHNFTVYVGFFLSFFFLFFFTSPTGIMKFRLNLLESSTKPPI